MSTLRSIRRDNLLELLKHHLRQLNLGQIVLLFIALLLTIWCFYNVRLICLKFYDYDTIISLQNDLPNITEFPGITICAPSIFKPQKLAQLYPSFNKSLNDFITWRRANSWDPFYEQNATGHQIHHDVFRIYESLALSSYPANEIINQLSIRPDELLYDCWYHPINVRNFQLSHRENQNVYINSKKCTAIKPILESIYEGKKCFTYFSALVDKEIDPLNAENAGYNPQNSKRSWPPHSPTLPNCSKAVNKTACEAAKRKLEEEQKWSRDFKNFLSDTDEYMVFDLNPSIELQIRALDEDYWGNYMTGPIVMTVHPPNILQNRRDFLFYTVAKSTKYELEFTKKTTLLLEKPYKTACLTYPIVEQYSGKRARTRDHCVSLCIASEHHKENGTDCANYYSVLTNSMFTDDIENMTICNHENQNYDNFIKTRDYCETICPNECYKDMFEVSGQMRSLADANHYQCPAWYTFDPLHQGGVDIEKSDGEDVVKEVEEETMENLVGKQLSPFKPARKWVHSSSNLMASKETERGHLAESYSYSNSAARQTHKSHRRNVRTGCNAKVSIRISPKPFTVVEHHQAISYEGVLGTVGGHIGIWLGLSLYKIIKFAINSFYALLYKVLRSCSPDFL